jgi:PAS domain-containing protein
MPSTFKPEMLKNLSREALEDEVLRLHHLLQHAEAVGQPSTDSHPMSNGLIEGRDVLAELHVSQTALAGSRARQRAIFDSSGDFAMVISDPEGIITDWNNGATHVMGWTQEEMRGHSLRRFFIPEDRAKGRPEYEWSPL